MEASGLILNIARMLDKTRTVLLATTSEGTPVLRGARQLALSLRLAKERKVAIVSLSEIGSQEVQPVSTAGDLVLDEPWRYAQPGGEGATLIYRAGSWSDGRASEWVSAEAFSALLEKLSGRFDLILVDAGSDPPPASQQLALAPLCSGTVLLVRPGISTAAEVQSCEALLHQGRARILGCVFVEGN